MFLGCGIAVPGLISADGDTVTYATTLAWDRVNLRPLLAARLQTAVVLVDRGKAAALGELWYRGRATQADLIYIYLGTGVGDGLVFNNTVHEGADRAAGEIGHMIVDPRGPLCKCGNHGCLETLISGPAVAMRAQAAIKAGRATLLTHWLAGQSLDALTAKMVADAALAGDDLALEILEQTAGYLGIAVANLVNLLNPQLVVLGGPASRWGNLLLEATQRAVQQRALDVPRRSVRIVLSQAGDVTVTLGAAAMILRQASQLLTAGW
jgi:glucokinase